MAIVKPFKAIRPTKDKVHLVASRSLDSYSLIEQRYKLQTNPFSFLRVIKPEYNEAKKSKPNSPELLRKIKNKFSDFISNKIFEKDEEASFFVYQQIKENDSYTGIIGCSAIDDYFNGTIKIHEQTITDREEKLMHYLEVCDFNAEPILMCHPDDVTVEKLINEATKKEPIYDFTTADRVRHKLWRVVDKNEVEAIEKAYHQLGNIYIADGHHRSASSALLGKYRRSQNKNYNGNEPYNYFLCAYFSESQLHIYDFNRVVTDLNGMYEHDFISKLQEKFDVEKKGNEIFKSKSLHQFSMYIGGSWYALTLKNQYINANDPVGVLDAALLSEHILSPILGIYDLKTDKRIGFVNGTKGMEELKNQVDSGKMKVAFGLYPVKLSQLKNIADKQCIMPPKTTYIEPKLRSGLLVYSLSEKDF